MKRSVCLRASTWRDVAWMAVVTIISVILLMSSAGCGWGNPTTTFDLLKGKYSSDKDFALYLEDAEMDRSTGTFKVAKAELTNTGSSVLAEKKMLWEMQFRSFNATMTLLEHALALKQAPLSSSSIADPSHVSPPQGSPVGGTDALAGAREVEGVVKDVRGGGGGS